MAGMRDKRKTGIRRRATGRYPWRQASYLCRLTISPSWMMLAPLIVFQPRVACDKLITARRKPVRISDNALRGWSDAAILVCLQWRAYPSVMFVAMYICRTTAFAASRTIVYYWWTANIVLRDFTTPPKLKAGGSSCKPQARPAAPIISMSYLASTRLTPLNSR